MHIHKMGVDFLLAVNPTSNLDSILILLKVRNLQIKGFDWLLEVNFTYQNATPATLKLPKFSKSKGEKKKVFASCFYTPKSFTFQLSLRKKTQHNITSMVNKLSIIHTKLTQYQTQGWGWTLTLGEPILMLVLWLKITKSI